ncbi:MAG: hypothetical protein VB060_06115 [Oscillibacter sp.]|nr:hypothetical protein [Oscillibacter sp.]MEA4993399.1 hypothetical protein [Oscillibacter sp.]
MEKFEKGLSELSEPDGKIEPAAIWQFNTRLLQIKP